MKDFSNESYYLIFSTLANRTRLAIIDILKDSPRSISEIAAKLKIEKEVVTVNLEPLEKCALVLSETSEDKELWSLNKEMMEPLSHILELHTAKHCPGLRVCIPQAKLKEYMKQEAARDTYIKRQ